MAKKRKLKKEVIAILAVIIFFVVYFIAFRFGTYLDQKNQDPVKQVEEKEDTRPLITQLKAENNVYISDSEIENIKIEESSWDEIKYLFTKFSKIRKPEKFTPVYSGYTDDGLKFSTDLNYLRIYTVKKEQYYKVPVDQKSDFEKALNESIYTSFDFIKQYKTWKNVTISYNNEAKTIHKWKFDDLSYKMSAKRQVGKIQPEKSKERSDYNFTINTKGDNYEVTIETMSKDYVKITSGDLQAYYEVYTGLFEYIKDNVFKIGVE